MKNYKVTASFTTPSGKYVEMDVTELIDGYSVKRVLIWHHKRSYVYRVLTVKREQLLLSIAEANGVDFERLFNIERSK